MITDYRLSDQFNAVFISFVLGAVFGIVFDFVRFIREFTGIGRPHGSAGTKGPRTAAGVLRGVFAFILDLFVSFLFTVIFNVISYVYCFGRLRAYTLISAFAGFALFRRFPGRYTARFASKSAKVSRKAARSILKTFSAPFRFALKKIGLCLRRFDSFVRRKREGVRKSRLTKKIASNLDVITDLTKDISTLPFIVACSRPISGNERT